MKALNNLCIIAFTLLTASAWTGGAHAQCDATAEQAQALLGDGFVSDGQSYRALLYGDQLAEFSTTLFGGNTYRIAGLGGREKGQLIFSLYDEAGHLLFSNAASQNAPYWDFTVDHTLECRLEARLDPTKQSSGCSVLIIGFER